MCAIVPSTVCYLSCVAICCLVAYLLTNCFAAKNGLLF